MGTKTNCVIERALLSLLMLGICVARSSENDAMRTAQVGVVPFSSARSAADHGVYATTNGANYYFLSAWALGGQSYDSQRELAQGPRFLRSMFQRSHPTPPAG